MVAASAASNIGDETFCKESYYFPLSFGQERLWFLDQLMPGTPLFNLNQAHRFSMILVPQLLERSLNEVVRRHEILRTTFHVLGGEPVQAVAKESRVLLPVIDLYANRRRVDSQQRRRACPSILLVALCYAQNCFGWQGIVGSFS